jgi:ribosomal protein S18 acetylase RimI-like enzyme
MVSRYATTFASRLARSCCAWLGRSLGTRSLIFLQWDLPSESAPEGGDADIRRVTAAEIRSWPDKVDGWYAREAALARMARGCELFVLRHEGHDACFGWVERGRGKIVSIQLPLSLPPEVAYLTALYTVPEFRRKGLARRTWLGLSRYCRRMGASRVFVVIDPTNEASLLLHRSMGFRDYQRIDYNRVLFLNCYRVRPTEGGKAAVWLCPSDGPAALWRSCWPPDSPAVARDVTQPPKPSNVHWLFTPIHISARRCN